jgi:hypothetical protein
LGENSERFVLDGSNLEKKSKDFRKRNLKYFYLLPLPGANAIVFLRELFNGVLDEICRNCLLGPGKHALKIFGLENRSLF